MIQLSVLPYILELVKPFKIAHGARTCQPTLIVELEYQGMKGYGEASAISYYNKNLTIMADQIVSIRKSIESIPIIGPEEFYTLIKEKLSDNFLISALDCAYHDLHAKLKDYSLHKKLGLNTNSISGCNYTLGIDDTDVLIREVKENPWPSYKIKTGGSHDLATILELRNHTNARFRIDANQGWNLEKGMMITQEIEKLDVEFIEQPFPIDKLHYNNKLRRLSSVPIIADENCQGMEMVDQCAEYFDGINIKLEKCGGLTPAIEMAKKARNLGLKIQLGCMTSSTIAISSAAQIAHLVDYLDIDGAIFIGNDPAEGVQIKKGKVIFPDTPGSGISLKENFS